ncbi:MAG TPA: hypothetical protein VFH45_09495 [Acidimicrobiales bacterium]|nr:hypothetical protein [Acidimicrobiales bacterium]
MAFRSDATFLVLHALRLKGFADHPVVAALFGLDDTMVKSALESMAGSGLVSFRQGRTSGWTLSAAGRARHGELVAAELDACGCRGPIDDGYRRFLTVNARLLEVCTKWQLRAVGGRQVPNDHSDAAYDAAVVSELGAVDDFIQPVCADLAVTMERLSSYGSRLAEARRRVDAGQGEWMTRPVIDSYHTIWFELHEDLLVTLGIERAREAM